MSKLGQSTLKANPTPQPNPKYNSKQENKTYRTKERQKRSKTMYRKGNSARKGSIGLSEYEETKHLHP